MIEVNPKREPDEIMITIPFSKYEEMHRALHRAYEDYTVLRERVSIVVERIHSDKFLYTEDILRILRTPEALAEADRIRSKEQEDRKKEKEDKEHGRNND